MELSITTSILVFVLGVALVLFSSEKLVEATVGTSRNLGISTFAISVIFIGFDAENLAVGAAASADKITGIALGTIFGSAMVAITLAFGITALITPMKFKKVATDILLIPVAALLFIFILSLDGMLSRVDGLLLLGGYMAAIFYIISVPKKNIEIEPSGELKDSLLEAEDFSTMQSVGWLLFSLAGIITGSEMLVNSADYMLSYWDLSDTVYGMTVLALLISIEELGRELPAALKGRPEISYGNVVGSVLAFFLFNAGVISIIQPISINQHVLTFYLPVCFVAILFTAFMMYRKRIPRWAGGLLVAIYILFFTGGFL
ncbi:MAG: hypothetical protein U5K69_25695 [Balneolaceae bacterium]|nr:hypothetical protein [Balneolaceae bacterium]